MEYLNEILDTEEGRHIFGFLQEVQKSVVYEIPHKFARRSILYIYDHSLIFSAELEYLTDITPLPDFNGIDDTGKL